MNLKFAYLLIIPVLVATGLYIIEQVLPTHYIVKTAAKITLFFLTAFIFNKLFSAHAFSVLNPKKVTLKDIITPLSLGIAFIFIILVSYLVMQSFVDLQSIGQDLQTRLKITAQIFIFVGLYIIIVNSFVEEFFFRGLIFLQLQEFNKPLAHLFSSLLFSIYHIMIFKSWFSLPLFLLIVIVLAAVGFIFNLLDLKSKTIYPSWIAHAFADSVIIAIGFRAFGMI